jgi:hypothetical protein
MTAIFWRKICSRIWGVDSLPPKGISQTNWEQSAVTTAMLGAKPPSSGPLKAGFHGVGDLAEFTLVPDEDQHEGYHVKHIVEVGEAAVAAAATQGLGGDQHACPTP